MSLARLVASGLGAGFAPVAPGTFGALAGLALALPLLAWSHWALLAGAILATAAGFVAIPPAMRAARLGPADDPGWIVIDEIAGQCCALLFIQRPGWAAAALAFAAFRVLDIAKPGPIGWADRQGGATGIMGDDLLAGLAAGVLPWAAHRLWPALF